MIHEVKVPHGKQREVCLRFLAYSTGLEGSTKARRRFLSEGKIRAFALRQGRALPRAAGALRSVWDTRQRRTRPDSV